MEIMNRPPQKVIKEAKKIASGLFRMNAKGADRYGFSVHYNNREICYGEFLSSFEKENRFQWILVLNTGKIRKAGDWL